MGGTSCSAGRSSSWSQFMGTLFLIAAVVGGTILVCQFALALFGLGHGGADFSHHLGGDFHGDAHFGDSVHGHSMSDSHSDVNHHSSSSRVFAMVSFRTLVAASAFFGVTG